MKRTILAGILGGLAMFLWSGIAHMALPLGEAGIQQIPNEGALLAAMQTVLPSHGLYMFPNMPAGMTQEQYQTKVTSGPSGLLIYFPKRDFSFGRSLAVEYTTELLMALLVTYLLSTSSAASFGARFGFFALAGLIAAFGTNMSYWNWYGFPSGYSFAYMFTIWMGYVFAGVVAASMKIGGSKMPS